MPIVQNEPNLARAPGNGRGRPGPGAPLRKRCKTNPISAGVSSLKFQVLSEPCETNPISPSARAPADEMCKTKPIGPPEDVGRGRPTYEEGQMCKTKPIRRPARWGRPDRSCETKPIGRPGRCRARTPNPRRAEGQSCKTKPIWRTSCAKQSQSVAGQPRPRYPTIPVFHRSNIPIPSPLCKTKPIGRRSGYWTIPVWYQSWVPR